MNVKMHERQGVGEPAGSQPRADRKIYARSRLTNGKDLLPNIDGRRVIARRYRDICSAIASDQGGFDRGYINEEPVSRFVCKLVHGSPPTESMMPVIAAALTK
jgi:hypothetical protein